MPHWVWVVDTATGHRMDRDIRALGRGFEPLHDPRYPDRIGPNAQPRPTKHYLGKDGKPAAYVHGESRFPDQDEIDAALAAQSDGQQLTDQAQPGVGGHLEETSGSDTGQADDVTSATTSRGRRSRTTQAEPPADTTTSSKE